MSLYQQAPLRFSGDKDQVNWVQGNTTYTVASADTLPSTIYARMRTLI